MNGALTSCFVLMMCIYAYGDSFYWLRDGKNAYINKYGQFTERERMEMLEESKKMFYFGYDNYLKYAFPKDELNPIDCCGRGPDSDNPVVVVMTTGVGVVFRSSPYFRNLSQLFSISDKFRKTTPTPVVMTTITLKKTSGTSCNVGLPSNININDVLGGYCLTLVESLDTLAVMGNASEFKKAVLLVIEHVSFGDHVVQLFESTIRVLGSLLSAHLIITDPEQSFGDMSSLRYDGQLLEMAHDLAARLMPAFSGTSTGIPYPRVNLVNGVTASCTNHTCTAGAGTLLLEFGLLSYLLDDPVYESYAGRAVSALWRYRSNVTGLLGNVIDIQSGEWVGKMSGLGAGMDSFYEYLLKAYILFGDERYLRMFNELYETVKFHMRKGRKECNAGDGDTPIYVNVNMMTGRTANTWVDSLQAAWSSVQVLAGDIQEAICSHAYFYSVWRKFGSLPERFNWRTKQADVLFYPLRPELVESTYFLYRATLNPFYLHVGREILQNISTYARAECGFTTIHDVGSKEQEDRMESFFLSETCKYLFLTAGRSPNAGECEARHNATKPHRFPVVIICGIHCFQLFDSNNHVNKHHSKYLFSTEGHIFPVDRRWRRQRPMSPPSDAYWFRSPAQIPRSDFGVRSFGYGCAGIGRSSVEGHNSGYHEKAPCDSVPASSRHSLPIHSAYLSQMEDSVGLQ